MNPRLHRWVAGGAPVLGLLGITLWLLAPLSLEPGSRLYDAKTFNGWFLNQPDVWLNAWILAWDTHALSSGQVLQLFDANIYYPERGALAFSEHLLGVLPYFAPVYLATGRLALSLNLWILLTFVLSGLAMYWVVWRWLGSRLAASVAAVTYAFAPWRFLELSHVQLLSVQYLPLLAYAIVRTGVRRDRRIWLAIFGLAAMQSLSSYYLGYMAFLVAGACALLATLLARTDRFTRVLFVGSALAAAALVMIPFSLPYLDLGARDTFRAKVDPSLGWWPCVYYLFPRLGDSMAEAWRTWLLIPPLALLGALLGVYRRGSRALTSGMLLAGTLGFVLALGPRASVFGLDFGFLDRAASALVPGWQAVRVMNRFGIVCWLALSLLAGLPFALGRGGPPWWQATRRLLGSALIAALIASSAMLELRTMPSPEQARDLTPYRWLATHGGGDPLVEWPLRSSHWNAEYMYLSTLHWLPLVNGYSGYPPPSHELAFALAEALPEPAAVRTISRLRLARWLLVHGPARAGRRPWELLEEAGAVLREQSSDFRIFELPSRGGPRPELGVDRKPRETLLGTPLARLESDDLEAELVPLERRLTDRLWLGLPVPMRLTNRSGRTWPAVGVARSGLVGLEVQVRQPGEEELRALPGFHRLPTDLAPGETLTLWPIVPAPRRPGEYELVPCLTIGGQEVHRCFEEASVTVEVR